MKAAIHLGRNFQENSGIYKNMKFENIENVFNITQILVKEQSAENSECEDHELPVALMYKSNTLQR